MSRQWGNSIMSMLWDHGGSIAVSGSRAAYILPVPMGPEPDVFYAPLDGSRLDYHPCGRPEDHPTYLDPDSPIGDERVAPEELHQIRREGAYYTAMHLCGRCLESFRGPAARGRYILHRCPAGLGPESLRRVEGIIERFRTQALETLEEWMARRDREDADWFLDVPDITLEGWMARRDREGRDY